MQLHGATYTVDVEFKTKSLVPKMNWVVDIGEALATLGKILAQYDFQNLDELFPGENTTTEFMCKVCVCSGCRENRLREAGGLIHGWMKRMCECMCGDAAGDS